MDINMQKRNEVLAQNVIKGLESRRCQAITPQTEKLL